MNPPTVKKGIYYLYLSVDTPETNGFRDMLDRGKEGRACDNLFDPILTFTILIRIHCFQVNG